MGESIIKMKDTIKFENIGSLPPLKSDFENKDFMIFDSRNETTRRITKAPEDNNVRMIGVYIMPNSGKSMLV